MKLCSGRISISTSNCNISVKPSFYLRVVEEGFLVVYAASGSLRSLPLAVYLHSIPCLLQGEKVRVHHAADRHVGEVLAVILHQHPVGES